MKIQYMSDLHMEFAENSRYIKHNEFPVMGEVLILAGDTFYLNNTVAPLGRFWKWASANFRQVLIVPGNHDYYGHYDIMVRGMQWEWKFKENVGYYQNRIVRIDDTDFILSTLWSSISPTDEYAVSHGLNDFFQTKYNGKLIQVNEYNQLHQFCLEFIKKSVAESTAEKIVVVTHHLPTRQVVAQQHHDSSINSAFATELGDFIANSRIDVWIYGHSHTNIDATIGKTKIVSNQLGYTFYNEHLTNGFDPSKSISLE